MNLKDLSKEQKQYVALGLLSAAILVVLMVLGIRFSMATISTAKEELDVLSDKINRANQALSRSKRTSEEYLETIAVLKKYLTNAPPERNYYSWATEVIYSKARFAGLEIDSIDEISIPDQRRSGGAEADAAAILLESYSLRIMGHGGYENTKYFIKLLKQDYPLVRFSGVEISSGQDPESHDVQLFMQWPFNFDDITKNWDAIATTQMKMAESNAGHEATSPAEPEPAPESVNSVTTVVDTPDPVREPHPPTTRPGSKATPAPQRIVEQAVPEKKPLLNTTQPMEALSVDVTPRPATRDEIQAILSGAAPRTGERMGSQPESTEPQSGIGPSPVAEPAIAVSETRRLVESELETVSDPKAVPDIAFGQKTVTSEAETPAFAVLLGEPAASRPEAPRNYLAIRKSEKLSEEGINTGGTIQDATLSSHLDGMLGGINEK